MGLLIKVKKLLKRVQNWDYGYIQNGKPKKMDFEEYKTGDPRVNFKLKTGVCWDSVHYFSYWFRRYYPHIKTNCYLDYEIEDGKPRTHAMFCFWYKEKLYCMETFSILGRPGLFKFKDEKAFIDLFIRARQLTTRIGIFKYDPPEPGLSSISFLDYVRRTGERIEH